MRDSKQANEERLCPPLSTSESNLHPPSVSSNQEADANVGMSSFSDDDVLSGRGGGTNLHPGNRYYRDLVFSHRVKYDAASKSDKPGVSRAIVQMIRERGGLFLRKDAKDGLYYEIGDDAAREKTSQALRHRTFEMRHASKGKQEQFPGMNQPPKSKQVLLQMRQQEQQSINLLTAHPNQEQVVFQNQRQFPTQDRPLFASHDRTWPASTQMVPPSLGMSPLLLNEDAHFRPAPCTFSHSQFAGAEDILRLMQAERAVQAQRFLIQQQQQLPQFQHRHRQNVVIGGSSFLPASPSINIGSNHDPTASLRIAQLQQEMLLMGGRNASV